MVPASRPLAVVTGGSSGIGLALARLAAEGGHDLLLAADRGDLAAAATELRAFGATVETLEADLATAAGVDRLDAAIAGRPVEALFANAGHGLGQGFLDQDFDAARHVIDTNITGTLDVLHRVGRGMRSRGRGRILITGSIAGLQPGAFHAVYNASKAFIDSFALALRNELQDTGVTVTCLMPGITDTAFFERAGLTDTKMGATEHKSDPADVARAGYDTMMAGEADVVAGLKYKVAAAMAHVTPNVVLAQQHRRMAEPGSADR